MAPKLKIQAVMRSGQPTLTREAFNLRQKYYSKCKDGEELDIIFQDHRETRSDEQRRYYFKHMVKPLCDGLWGETHSQSLERMNDYLKKNFNCEYYITPDGVEEVLGMSLEKERTDKVEKIYDQIKMWAMVEHGIRLYKPNEAPDED